MDYFRAPDDIMEAVAQVAKANHRDLYGRKIAVIMQDKATKRLGRFVAATASRPSKRLQPLLDDHYAFVICIAMDEWQRMNKAQRTAVIDHELCHCAFDEEGQPAIRPHDYEEFAEVLERHGWWRNDYAEKQVQQALGLDCDDGVTVGTLAGEDK